MRKVQGFPLAQEHAMQQGRSAASDEDKQASPFWHIRALQLGRKEGQQTRLFAADPCTDLRLPHVLSLYPNGLPLLRALRRLARLCELVSHLRHGDRQMCAPRHQDCDVPPALKQGAAVVAMEAAGVSD